MSARRSPAEAPAAVARAPRPRASAPPPRPAQDLAAAARAVGAEVSSGPDFMEISFPSPGAAHAFGGPRRRSNSTGGTVVCARAPGCERSARARRRRRDLADSEQCLDRAVDDRRLEQRRLGRRRVVGAVLRAMREENEHLGILDGIDPLY